MDSRGRMFRFLFFFVFLFVVLFCFVLLLCWLFVQSIWGDMIWSRLADKTAKQTHKIVQHTLPILTEILYFLTNQLIICDFY